MPSQPKHGLKGALGTIQSCVLHPYFRINTGKHGNATSSIGWEVLLAGVCEKNWPEHILLIDSLELTWVTGILLVNGGDYKIEL